MPEPATDPRVGELRRAKRQATALLAVVAVVYVGLVLADLEGAWAYALAAAEGSMVGGLADWFAVTALFRHPLGIPIPHTAVIRERKDQFGETLGGFVQENFLRPDIVGERVRQAGVPARVATWLSQPGNADTVGRTVLEGVVGGLDLVRDADVHRLIDQELEQAVAAVNLAPIAGRVLTVMTDEGRHHELLDFGLRGVINFLEEQREPLRARFGESSPWWLPGAVEDKLFDRIIDGARLLLASVVADPDHDIRKAIDTRIAELAERLRDDPALAARGEQLKHEILEHEALRRWTAGLWDDAKTGLRAQAPDPGSDLRRRLAGAIAGLGERLGRDEALQAKLEGWAESAARYVVDHYRDEIGALISETVALWDAQETSDKLELLLGRDLQFIRINGTLVGGLAGLAIHGLGDLLG